MRVSTLTQIKWAGLAAGVGSGLPARGLGRVRSGQLADPGRPGKHSGPNQGCSTLTGTVSESGLQHQRSEVEGLLRKRIPESAFV